MSMQIDERSYGGKIFRPRPEIHIDNNLNFIAIVCPWGQRSAALTVIEKITEFMSVAKVDQEVTTPYQPLMGLSSQANRLRTAALLANDSLFRRENANEYTAGVELLLLSIEGQELTWVQVGQPQIYLARKNQKILPLSVQIDLAADYSEEKNLLAPLPTKLLGIDTEVNMSINSIRIQPEDKLILIAHSNISDEVLHLKPEMIDIMQVSQKLSQLNPQAAYWLALLKNSEGS